TDECPVSGPATSSDPRRSVGAHPTFKAVDDVRGNHARGRPRDSDRPQCVSQVVRLRLSLAAPKPPLTQRVPGDVNVAQIREDLHWASSSREKASMTW